MFYGAVLATQSIATLIAVYGVLMTRSAGAGQWPSGRTHWSGS